MPADGSVYFNGSYLEPTAVDALVSRGVNSISLLNQIRPNSVIAARCTDTLYHGPIGARFLQADGLTLSKASLDALCLHGDVAFFPG